MAESAGKKASKAFVWVLLLLLIVGLAGFGVQSFSGGASSVATVGSEKITAQQYFRALVRTMQAEQAAAGQVLTPADVQARGIPAAVRAQLAGAAALDNEARRIGLSVGDAAVAEQIRAQGAFNGLDGSFDRESYEFSLRQNGWSVREFEQSVRNETARALLQSAVASGNSAPDAYLDVVLGYYGERRSYEWVRFGEEAITAPIDARSEADVQAYYDANPALFTLPTRKRVTYAWLSPETLLDDIEPDDSALRALYDERIDEYVRPERRLVERLVFSDQASAEAAKTALDEGNTTFTALVEERGLSLADVDLGEVVAGSLGEASDPIFALEQPDVVGPLPSSLGPALYRMNAILNASEITFEQARTELTPIYARDAARREIEARMTDYDDRLAAGATVEDLAAETEMVLGTDEIWAGSEGGLADYDEFRRAVDALGSDDFPEILLLGDGGIYAMRLDEVLDPSLQPLDEVRAEALAGAEAEAVIDTLRASADAALSTAEATGSLDSTGTVERADLVTRDAAVGAVPVTLPGRAFEMEVGEVDIVEGSGAVFLLKLTAVEGPDPEDERSTILRQGLSAQISQGLSSDMVVMFTQAMTNSAGIRFNDAALNAVEVQVFTGGHGGGY